MNFTSRIVTNDLNQIINGINKAADIVKSTMGGAGRNVIITNNDDKLVFTKDGVSVAKEIRFKDSQENIGAQLLINASKQTVKDHGDGTTLTCLLVKEFTKELFQYIQENPDTDVNELLDKVKSQVEEVCKYLRSQSKFIDTNYDIYKIAYTSSKSPRLANFIAEIYSKTGLKANISIENSKMSNNTYYDVINGLSFDGGMITSSFANKDNGTCYFEKPFIFVTSENVTVPSDYEDLLDSNFKSKTPLVMIAPIFSDAFIRFCISNVQRNGLEICLIRTPGYGAGMKENMRDIIAFLNPDGTCSSIKITGNDFTIFNETDKNRIAKRVDQLQSMAEEAVEDYDEKSYRERISRLNQSGAIIYVGGITEKNAKEEYDRLEDAIGAVKSAIKGGYVRGAGIELFNAPISLNFPNDDIVTRICLSPFYTIFNNARININDLKKDIPYNIRTKQYDENIIDPTEVLCSALENSFALVELLINTSHLIYNEKT